VNPKVFNSENMYKLWSIVILLIGLNCIPDIDAVAKRDHNDYNAKPRRLVCYFGSWANYHTIDPFLIEDIDPNLCTHLNYGFAKLNEFTYTIEAFDPWLDFEADKGGHYGAYKRFNDLRKQNPHLTTMIAIGGWYEGSEKYSDMAKDPHLRKLFVESCVEFLTKYDFDGLDVDWEYPSNRGGDKKVDKENFISLLTELKAAFEPHGFLLSAAVSPGKNTIDSAYIMPKLNDLLDIINVMAYDYHGGWEDTLGHNAPLYKRDDEHDLLSFYFNVNYTVNYWLELGIDKKKMVMGLPFYGRAWTLQSADKVKLNDTAKGMSPAGFMTGEEGVLGYNEVFKSNV
jgi:chitinase